MTDVPLVIDVERLLAPIGPDPARPAGRDIRHDPLYTEINLARRGAEAAVAPAAQASAWARVADLSTDALALHSKHLQVAVWLTEALARLEAFRGAATGFNALAGLLDRYWESLHPAIEPGDSEPLALRSGPLHWVADRLPDVVKGLPLTDRAPDALVHFEATLKSGEERQALLDDGWPTGDQFRYALRTSTPAFLTQTRDEVTACQNALAALEALTDRRFVETRTMPGGESRTERLISFASLREALEAARGLLAGALSTETGTGPTLTRPASAADGSGPHDADEGLAEARTLVASNQIEGFRVLQARVTQAASGRERFLRRLQFAEICLEAGMFSLALPMYVDLTRVIEERTLVTWERHDVILRAWRGLKTCCEHDGRANAELASVYQQAISALSQLESASPAG